VLKDNMLQALHLTHVKIVPLEATAKLLQTLLSIL
jgi:hypothetical protein